MKSFEQPKANEEWNFIQGSISKSPNGGKRPSQSSGMQHKKRAVSKDSSSTLGGVSAQHDDCNPDKGYSLAMVSQVPLDAKPKGGRILHSSAKIKLQLFPLDDVLRKGLEKDGHNPFLELTLSTRKKISSVLNHLRNKWGSSSIAMGELMLFPFNVASDKVFSFTRWTSSEIGITAGDVHAALGCPELFRLRYGWISCQPNASSLSGPEPSHVKNGCCPSVEGTSMAIETSKEPESCNKNELADMTVQQTVPSEPLTQVARKNEDEIKSEDLELRRSSELENDIAVRGNSSSEPSKYEEPRGGSDMSLTTLLWSDLSNISIGCLLSEVSMQGRFNTEDPKSGGSRLIATDSLDAFIEKYKCPQASTTQCPDMPSSILDAESTCHSFPFSKQQFSSKELPSSRQGAFSGLSDQKAASESFKCPKTEVNAQSNVLSCSNVQEPKSDSLPCSIGPFNNENSLGLSSIKWNDSLGPFDLPLTSRQIIKDDTLSSIGELVR